LELLAFHYARSGQRERAATYLERAGDKARSEHAFSAAAEFYRELLKMQVHSDRDTKSACVREKLGEVLLVAAQYDEAVQVLAEAAETYRRTHDGEGEVRAVARLGHAHFRRGTATEGIRQLEPLLAKVEECGSEQVTPRTLMELEFALTHLYYSAERFRESLASAMRVAELARCTDDASMLAEAEVVRGVVLCALSSPTEGAPILEEGLKVGEQMGALRTRENGLQVLAGIYLIRGELEKGRTLLEQAISLAEAEEDRATLVIHLALLGRFCFVGGNWRQAHAHLVRAVEIARSIGPAWYTMLPLTQLGVLLEAQGEWEEAARWFEEVMAGTGSGRVARTIWPVSRPMATTLFLS
jgi:tetratricopeptide (TPR) repeat protein